MSLEATLAELRAAAEPTLIVEADPGSPLRVAMLPGSFDPITIAHTALAEAAAARADLVVLIYSARTVDKEEGTEPPLLKEQERIRAVRDVCAGREVWTLALCSHGLLVDQVDAARGRFPEAELRLVIGSDKVLQVLDPKWYGDADTALTRLFSQADVMYAVREGEAAAVQAALGANARWSDKFLRLDVPPEVAAISSREVRSRLREGQDVTHLVPLEARWTLGPKRVPPGRDGKAS
jgi:nicotinamide-nucleotide adenylyltransferase